MSVPNQYKGFSKLPEAVQQKMSPELARKYQMGGSVMQRPLFRQMGGAAAPPPMAPAPAPAMPMAPPPNQGMDQRLAFAEQAGQQLGTEAAMETMTRLDGAQDYETLIDGIRGNEKPIEARYAELAGLVGEQDARQTPESVLTLTQPTIMMTEQGALDSGIGELIQSVMGDTQMTGDMRGGVGSLMEKGAGNTPPVNFNQGGPVEVQKFDNGGVADRAVALQQSFLPAFQGIYGTPKERQEQLEKDKRFAQSQILFDIAQAGLNLAGTTQGNTLAERLAAASSGLPQAIGQRAASVQEAERALKAQDQQAKAAALQAGISQMQTEQAQKFAMEQAALKNKPKSKFLTFDNNMYEVSGEKPVLVLEGADKVKTTTVGGIVLDITDPKNIAVLYKSDPEQKTTVIDGQLIDYTNLDDVKVLFGDKTRDIRVINDEVVDLTDPENPKTLVEAKPKSKLQVFDGNLYRLTEGQDAEIVLESNRVQSLFGAGDFGKAATYVSNEDLLQKYATGTLDKANDGISDVEMNVAFEIYTSPVEGGYDPEKKTTVMKPGADYTPAMMKALRLRQAKGLSLPPRAAVMIGDLLPSIDISDNDITNTEVGQEKIAQYAANIQSPFAADLSDEAFGSDAFVRKIFNIFVESGSFGLFGAPFEGTKSAIKAVENLNQQFVSLYMDMQEIKDSVFQAEELKVLVPKPASLIEGSDDAKQAAKTLYNRLAQEIEMQLKFIRSEEIALKQVGDKSLSDKRQSLPKLYSLLNGYGILAGIVDATGTKSPRRDNQKGQTYDQNYENKLMQKLGRD